MNTKYRNSIDFAQIALLDQSVIDELLKMTKDDNEMLVELFSNFYLDFENLLLQFKEGINNQNFDVLKKTIHTLKGLCGTIGASRLNELAKYIENEIIGKDLSQMDDLIKYFENTYFEAQKLFKEIIENR